MPDWNIHDYCSSDCRQKTKTWLSNWVHRLLLLIQGNCIFHKMVGSSSKRAYENNTCVRLAKSFIQWALFFCQSNLRCLEYGSRRKKRKCYLLEQLHLYLHWKQYFEPLVDFKWNLINFDKLNNYAISILLDILVNYHIL